MPPRHYRVRRFGLIRRVLAFFIDSPLTPLILFASLALGVLAVHLLPREEEPQITVPMIDIFVGMPGTSALEIEQRVTRPLEKLLWELPGVEYLYATSSPGGVLMIARFLVGWDEDRAIVDVNQKLAANFDVIPHGATPPLIKARQIDDVPILALTLHGPDYDAFALRRIAAAVDDAVKPLPDVAETRLIGGLRRQVRVELDAARLTAWGLDANEVVERLDEANRQSRAGSVPTSRGEMLVETGGFLRNAAEVAAVVLGVHQGQLVYLRDVAEVSDGPAEADDYVLFGYGRGHQETQAVQATAGETPAVTLTLAKRPGTNAIDVGNRVLAQVERLHGTVIPADVTVTVTRNYGRTATEKSDELLFHMALAVVGVSLLVGLVLGWREALVVAIAIPMTLALTLATFQLLGFTLNRVTLFALIFSIGILVDDPIVDVENIVRHFRLPARAGVPLTEVIIDAVNEVRSPLILATLTVIAAVLPMAFVQGLMGPYMRPIPVGATAAMLFSMAVSFIVTPWAANRMLAGLAGRREERARPEDWSTRLYRRVMGPLIRSRALGLGFLAAITLLLLAAVAMVAVGAVKVKMLPFDNKSEVQLIIDMDEGTTLEQTAAVALDIARVVREVPEVIDYQVYVGTAAPYNFNGLVRRYFLRHGPTVADIQVNLVPREERKAQSHAIARQLRERIAPLVAQHGARVKVAEVPPGPPVLQTLVAELYGPDYGQQIEDARRVRDLFESMPGVVDVDWYMEEAQPRLVFRFDQEKAALLGVSAEQVEKLLRLAQSGMDTGLLHVEGELEDVPIRVRLPLAQRAAVTALLPLPLRAVDGRLVPLGEVVRIEISTAEHSRYRKNLLPVVYVTGDVAGAEESPVYAILKLNPLLRALGPDGAPAATPADGLAIWSTRQPDSVAERAMKWDGEWHITYEVFRDLGAAFLVVLLLIYTLIVGWFRSLRTPFIIMAAIPFSLVGILPAHWALGAFFTATSMIGFMAGAGIVVRNSIILVDFIKLRLREGMPIQQAVVDAGAIRFRPMMLTAAAVIVGGSVILFDPIFQGLAISLMAGEVASLLLSRMAVPIIYYQAMYRRYPEAAE